MGESDTIYTHPAVVVVHLGYKGKAALLIGCNYEGQRNDLRGCVNDVLQMREMLVERFSFDDDQIVLLSDGDAEVYVMSHSVEWQ